MNERPYEFKSLPKKSTKKGEEGERGKLLMGWLFICPEKKKYIYIYILMNINYALDSGG